jgi:hypothetical protein
MINREKLKYLVLGITVCFCVVIALSATTLLTAADSAVKDSGNFYLNAKTDFGAVGDGVSDDTVALQTAINECCRQKKSLCLPNGTYLISNLTIPGSINIEGEHRSQTVLKSKGTQGAALEFTGNLSDLRSKSRSKLSNFMIVGCAPGEALDYGIRISSTAKTLCPYEIEFDSLEVRDLQKDEAVGCYVDDVSLLSCDNCQFQTKYNGTAFLIEAHNLNTGVFSFKNTAFGNTSADRYGLVIGVGSAIDSINFSGCYFGGKVAAEKIGNGNNVRTVSHESCHFENACGGETQLVDIQGGSGVGGIGLAWRNCTFSAFNSCKYGFHFAPGGVYYSFEISGCEFVNLNSEGFVIDNNTGHFSNCRFETNACVGTHPLIFSSMNLFDDISQKNSGGWTYTENGYEIFPKGIKIGQSRINASTSMPTSGFYTKGDIVLNTGEPFEYGTAGSKYIIEGWKRKTTGSNHTLNVDWLEMRTLTGN